MLDCLDGLSSLLCGWAADGAELGDRHAVPTRHDGPTARGPIHDVRETYLGSARANCDRHANKLVVDWSEFKSQFLRARIHAHEEGEGRGSSVEQWLSVIN
jgi:hypothetical protein